MDDRGSTPGRGWDFALHHRVQTGSATHPTPYPMGKRGVLSWGYKAAGE